VIKAHVPIACLILTTACPVFAAAPAPLDKNILHLQVVLDRLGFSPGVIDGQKGAMLSRAIKGVQLAQGFQPSGSMDEKTAAFLKQYDSVPGTLPVVLSAADVAGPYQGKIPSDPAEQAKLPALGYQTLMERLAERFHTTPETLIALNSPDTPLKQGSQIVVPAAAPASRDYPADLPEDWKATLSDLNVEAKEPEAAKLVVDKSDGVLRVYDKDEKLVAQFPATMGSQHDPLPIGHWKVQGKSYLPKFHYNPKLFWDASAKETKQVLPSGPNGPVGVVWLDLNKPHYGIHGTPEPSRIGRSESHGCIRLTNWDAARLALMVKPGTPAIFQP
jgi:lipoprotein-anchoring transpeptidase ErfK/SrfK